MPPIPLLKPFKSKPLWGVVLLVAGWWAGVVVAQTSQVGEGASAPALPGVAYRLVDQVELPDDAQAVAISADESLLAVGLADGVVVFVDRRSRHVVGSLKTDAGDDLELRFSPGADLLAVAGEDQLELWQVSAGPMHPERPLADTYRVWRETLDEAPLAGLALLHQPALVLWTEEYRIKGRGILPESRSRVMWQGDAATTIQGLSLEPRNGLVAVWEAGSKQITLLEATAGSLLPKGNHTAHRLPVVAATFVMGQGLVSLDMGQNLLLWSGKGLPEGAFVEALPTDPPVGLLPLPPDRVLRIPDEGGPVQLVGWHQRDVTQGPTVVERPNTDEGVAVSPSGRYVGVVEGDTLRLFEMTRFVSPLAYVRHLQALNAPQVAASFAAQADNANLPQGLLNELERQARLQQQRLSPATAGGGPLEALRQAVEAEDLSAMKEWAAMVLQREPGNEEALNALALAGRLEQLQELEWAQQEVENGDYRGAIQRLSGLMRQPGSLKAEAEALLLLAEKRRNLQSLVVQAQEQLDIANLPAARALVEQVLAQDENHPAAQALLEKIEDREGGLLGRFRTLGWSLFGLVLLVLGLLGLRRYRLPAGVRAAEPKPKTNGAAKTKDNGANKAANKADAEAASMGEAKAQGASRGERLFVVNQLLEKVEDMVRLARFADVQKTHSALLLELEAEIHALQKRLQDGSANLDAAERRLRAMTTKIHQLRFEKPKSSKSAPTSDMDYYTMLGVDPSASPAELKKAYHQKLKQYHPDLHNQSGFGWIKEEAERMSKALSKAYETLGDPQKRAAYDASRPVKS